MSVPPCLMRLKIKNSEHNFSIWLPLFLAWIILFLFALALAPLVLVVSLLLWPAGYGKFLLMLGTGVFRCICALRGLHVDVCDSNEEVVYISVK